jgi:alpha-acetolactate decarboxylase
MKKLIPLSLLLVLVLPALPVFAQHGAAPPAPQDAAGANPFEFSVQGVFRDMVQRRDFESKTTLAAAIGAGATEGVGALSGLRGEVTIVQGRAVVTCGSRATCARAEGESATLLATAKARAWGQPMALPADMGNGELGDFIDSQARARGLSLSQPFPLRVVGALANVRMHVVSAPNPKFAGHGAAEPMAIQDEEFERDLDGEVVGVRVPPSVRGVATHPGEAFHFHWVDTARTRTAHLDEFRVKAGALLLLPLP